jgi:hypothetical protein
MFDTCDYEVNLEVFPNYDCEVYAEWKIKGFIQDFEGNIDTDYDINEGAEVFKPGVIGYNPKYYHTGNKSMHARGDSEVAPRFLVGYEYMLEVGQQYDINFWMCAKEDGASGVIEILHALYGDVNDTIVGAESVRFENLKDAEWVQYRITFTANAPYIVFRTSKGVDLFFDDFHVVPLGTKGELGDIDGFNPDDIVDEPEEDEDWYDDEWEDEDWEDDEWSDEDEWEDEDSEDDDDDETTVIPGGSQVITKVLNLGILGYGILALAALLLLALIAIIVILIVVAVKGKKAAKAAAALEAAAAATEIPETTEE